MRAFAAALLPIVLFACGGETRSAAVADAGAAADADASAASAMDGGQPPAITSAVARIRIDHVVLGGSDCYDPYIPVEYDRQTRLMTWPACPDDAGLPTSGPSADGGAVSRVLSPAEASSVEQALAVVTYQDPPTCEGEDGEEYYMTTYDASGGVLRVYSALDINCTPYATAPGMIQVYQRLVQLRMG